MAELPGHPVNVACEKFSSDRSSDLEIIASLGQAVGVWYNTSGEAGDCFDFDSVSTLDDEDDDWAWDYQSCTELILPSGMTGEADFFWEDPWDYETFVTDCRSWFPSVSMTTASSNVVGTSTTSLIIQPQPDFITTFYAGYEQDYSQFSNMIFTNGGLDPWSVAGLPTNLSSISPTMQSIVEVGAAHHLDLRAADSELDPIEVVAARVTIRQTIHNWLDDGITLDEAQAAQDLLNKSAENLRNARIAREAQMAKNKAMKAAKAAVKTPVKKAHKKVAVASTNGPMLSKAQKHAVHKRTPRRQ